MTPTSTLAAAAVAILVSLVAPAASAVQPLTLTVDCARGHTISHALEQGDARKPLVLIIRGTCAEFVTITRDDVTLQGDPQTGATVSAPNASANAITVRATRIVIDHLTVEGGLSSITVAGTFDVAITNSVIQNASQNGINLMISHARINGNTIQDSGNHGIFLNRASALIIGNQIHTNAFAGVSANARSGVTANQNTITSNGSNGIELNGGSQGTIVGNTITGNGTNQNLRGNGVFVSFSNADIWNGNVITGNRDSGVAADGSALSVSNNTITGNPGGGVFGYLGTTLVVTGGTINDNLSTGILLSTNSTGQLDGATIKYNSGPGILLAYRSKLQVVQDPTDASDNAGSGLECQYDSSAFIDSPTLLIGPITGCTIYPGP